MFRNVGRQPRLQERASSRDAPRSAEQCPAKACLAPTPRGTSRSGTFAEQSSRSCRSRESGVGLQPSRRDRLASAEGPSGSSRRSDVRAGPAQCSRELLRLGRVYHNECGAGSSVSAAWDGSRREQHWRGRVHRAELPRVRGFCNSGPAQFRRDARKGQRRGAISRTLPWAVFGKHEA